MTTRTKSKPRKRSRKAVDISSATLRRIETQARTEAEKFLWDARVKFQANEFGRVLEKYAAVVLAVNLSGHPELIRQVDEIIASSRAGNAAGDVCGGEHAGAKRTRACRELAKP